MKKQFNKKTKKKIIGLSAVIFSVILAFVTIGLVSSFILAIKIIGGTLSMLIALFLFLFGIFTLGDDKNVQH